MEFIRPFFTAVAANRIVVGAVLLLAIAALVALYRVRKTLGEVGKLSREVKAIAEGHYDRTLQARGSGKVEELVASLNELSGRLKHQAAEIRQSEEALNRAHTRFGEALRSTHDMPRMLEIALDTGMETVRAERGLVLLRRGAGSMTPAVGRNLDVDGLELPVGRGIAGHVALTGDPVRVPGDSPLERDEREPDFKTLLSVPLFSQNRVMGVLNLYDKRDGQTFTEADLRTIVSLTDQAAVAIENVRLHQEAQRMAIMDGLTGIWNDRWFKIQFAQELDRAERFGRPFSLILMDIDDFKSFNDKYGHLVGDFVLVELARRVKSVIRDVDMFARYGGEEFELLLSETDAAGGLKTAEKLRAVVGDTPFVTDLAPEPLRVTVSVGVASYPQAGLDRASIFRAADMAMYAAKAAGKNTVRVHQPSTSAAQ
ncbi:MAG: diguanylate cyclase [Actinomycetota bacterium]|nr:diguanylate cyclase [Actinomycetota bacterium]